MDSASSWDGNIGFCRQIRESIKVQTPLPLDETDDLSETLEAEMGVGELFEFETESDLEDDLQPTTPRQAATVEEYYKQFCSDFNVIPCSPFIRKIEDDEIDISHYNIGPKGTKAVAKALKTNTTTSLLNLHDNGIGTVGAKALAEMLQENCFITALDISMNLIKEEGVRALSRMLAKNKYIVELSLESTKITSAGIVHLAAALRENYTLRMLNLSSNEIGEEGGIELANAIHSNHGIVYLDLSCNHIRNKVAISLAKAIAANTTLKTVDLSHNGFADDGSIAVGDALKVNSRLRELRLNENRIGEQGVWGLAIGMEENTGLKILDIGNNPFMSRGAILLAEALIVNESSSLEELYLDDVTVSGDFERVLADVMERKQDLYVQFGKIVKGKEHRRRGKKQKDLVSRILDAIELRGIRIMDFFRAMDKKARLAISKQEFITGLKNSGIPMRMTQVDDLFELLDVDGNGLAQYAEFVKLIKERTHEEFAKSRNNFQWNH